MMHEDKLHVSGCSCNPLQIYMILTPVASQTIKRKIFHQRPFSPIKNSAFARPSSTMFFIYFLASRDIIVHYQLQ